MKIILKGRYGEVVEFEDVTSSPSRGAATYRMVVTSSDGTEKAHVELLVEDIKRLAKAS